MPSTRPTSMGKPWETCGGGFKVAALPCIAHLAVQTIPRCCMRGCCPGGRRGGKEPSHNEWTPSPPLPTPGRDGGSSVDELFALYTQLERICWDRLRQGQDPQGPSAVLQILRYRLIRLVGDGAAWRLHVHCHGQPARRLKKPSCVFLCLVSCSAAHRTTIHPPPPSGHGRHLGEAGRAAPGSPPAHPRLCGERSGFW